MRHIEREDNSFQGEKERRERIRDQELGNLLSAVGNSESKALTLLAMEEGIMYSQTSLHDRTIEIQGKQPLWRMSRPVSYSYCLNSFEPIGLVARQVIDQWHNVYGYIKTPYGEEYGDALASLMLSFSERHPDLSLFQLFASTKSSGKKGENNLEKESSAQDLNKKRAPLTRLKIFRVLVDYNSSFRETDLAELVGENNGIIGKHLGNLSRFGIITYSSTKADTSFTVYSLDPEHPVGPPPPYQKDPLLSQFIYKTILKGKSLTTGDLTELYIAEKGEDYLGEVSQGSLKNRISHILSFLREQGYLNREEGFNDEQHSKVALTDAQYAFLRDLVQIIDRFQSNDRGILQEGRKYGERLLQDTKKVAELFKKAKEASPGAQRRDRFETQSLIFSLIKENPGSTSRIIQEELAKKYGILLDRHTVNKSLSSLRVSGQLDVMERTHAKYYKARRE